MYKTNPSILKESTSEDEVIMYDQENKNTIILNFTAKMLYENLIDNDYDMGISQYLSKAEEVFNVNREELENDAKSTFQYLLNNNILVEVS